MRRLVPLAFVLLIFGLAGCNGDSPPEKREKSYLPEPNENFPAYEVEGTDSAGKRLRLSDYKGKVILVDFWAGWCRPCLMLVPHEKELFRSLQDKPFVMIGVNGDDTVEELREAEQKHSIPWRSVWDGDRFIGRQWGVRSLPTLFLIDHSGIVRYRFKGVGPTTEEDLDAAIKDLLRKAQPRRVQ